MADWWNLAGVAALFCCNADHFSGQVPVPLCQVQGGALQRQLQVSSGPGQQRLVQQYSLPADMRRSAVVPEARAALLWASARGAMAECPCGLVTPSAKHHAGSMTC